MPAYSSAAERRAAFREELTLRAEKRVAALRKPKPAPVLQAVSITPRPAVESKPAPTMPHDHIRNGTALINWNDPEDMAYVHQRMSRSDVHTGHRNMVETMVEREQRLQKNRAEYARRCEQDEARIRQSTGDGPTLCDARAAWWPSMTQANAARP